MQSLSGAEASALPHPICYHDASLPHRRRYLPGTRIPEEFRREELQRLAPANALATYRPIASVTSRKRQPVTKLDDAMRGASLSIGLQRAVGAGERSCEGVSAVCGALLLRRRVTPSRPEPVSSAAHP
jgi:hypothetical protein